MLAHNGQIIALGQVKHNGSLSGTGAPGSELGVTNYEGLATQEWVFAQHYASAAPSGDYATKQYVDNGDTGVKSWTTQQLEEYAKKSELPDLTPYLTTQAAKETYWPKSCSSDYYKKSETYNRTEIDEKTKAYSGRNGIKIENHIISVSADYALASDLQNYYTKQQTYTRDEIDARLNNLGGYEVVANSDPTTHEPILPAGEEPSNKYIYLVKVDGVTPDSYYEWIWQENENPQWQCIGTTSLDLTEYVTETELATTLQDYATNDYVSANYALKTEIPSDFYTKQEVNDIVEPFITSAEADSRYQLKGEYLTEADIAHLNAASAGWNETQQTVDQNKDKWNTVEDRMYTSAFNGWSANADIQPYVGANGIEVDGHTIKPSASWVEIKDLSAYYKKSETSGKEQLATEFEKYQLAGDYALKDDLDNYVPNSAASAWDVTKYTEGEGIKITGHEISISADYIDPIELETALKPYAFTSAVSGFKNTLVKSSNGTVEISAYMENGVQVYDLSATQGGDYTQIVGENGVSAEKNEDTGEWHVGMNWDQNLISYGKFYTSPAQEYASSAAFAGYTMVDHISGDPDENDIDLDNDKIVIKKHGLYHVDVLVSVNIDANDTSLNYYTVTLKSGPNETLHQIDASYPHTEYINFSYDINTPTDDYILDNTIKDLPVGAEFKIENMNVHRVLYSTGDMYGQGGATYIGGDGITIDQDTINVNIGKGLELNNQTEKKLQVKLGKGLTYGTGDEIDAIVLDDPTEEVVKTVTDLKQELDNKLTTNMNISDAKKIGSMFKNTTYGTMGCSLFTVPLQHKLTTDTQVSFFTTQGLNQQASFPIVVGILEYNFDYWDDDRKQYRSQTNWIADTGPIFNNTPDVNGNTLGAGANKYTFKLNHVTPVVSADYMYGGKKYHNEYGPVLRSDRAYYLAVFAKHPDGLGYVLGDEGYDSPTNSDPYISYYCNNMVYNDGDPTTSGTMDNNWTHWDIDLSISAMNYWNRGGEAKEIVRPFVMIRNPMA